MNLDFRIDWGYQYLYSRRHYHPVFHWDGHLDCSNGRMDKLFKLDYPVIWYGPGHCAHETLLPGNSWESSTKRGMAGVRVQAEVNQDTVFTMVSAMGTFEFSARDILDKGRIEFAVGPKYLNCHVIVTRAGYYWFQPPAQPGQTVLDADDLATSVPLREWARMRCAWVDPQQALAFSATLPESTAEACETIIHVTGMAAPAYTPGQEKQAAGEFPLTLYRDGEKVADCARYFRYHDTYMQLLEDLWMRFPYAPGKHEYSLKNGNENLSLLVTRITLQNSEHGHLELSLPAWALVGEALVGRVYALKADSTEITYPGGSCNLNVQPGWNEFRFTLQAPGVDVPVKTTASSAVIGQVYDLREETPEVTVGYDMTVVPHDDTGCMDWLLDYTWRTRLGNLVVFRNLRRDCKGAPRTDAPDSLLNRWGSFCRDHHIYVEAATDFDSGALTKSAGNMLHSVGRHEWPGAVYAFDPGFEWRSEDMKTAMEHYMKRLKIEIDRAHKVSPRAAFGDASGGHRYCYMAGADFLRTETMVPHTQHLCSQARPAAEALSDGEWGVHIAIQHAFQPYYETHLGQYFLSLFQPWMMGASMIYEEDSLFELFKEERQAWDDAMTKGKRDMTRDFYRFVKTHPRTGKVTRKIAFVEGRYAAPFNGFICDVDQDPGYAVWGLFGKNDPLWGHIQPEKCRQLLDVLMPGASTQPLRQDYAKRRFFFSGTPYGDFDEVPTEAKPDYFDQYSLLLHLGWNTMIQEDYDKLSRYVANGGTLLIGLPEFSRHVRREFLADMIDLNLWNDGDLRDLCGVEVLGVDERFSGQWNCPDHTLNSIQPPDLSGIPSNSPEEDGPCRMAKLRLSGAEPFVWDASTGKVLVSRFRKGKGTVYLLTCHAYPGHEALRKLMAQLIAWLAAQHQPECHVVDPSRELFWNEWQESSDVRRLMILNTDWTTAGNVKRAQVITKSMSFDTEIAERQPKIFTVLPTMVLEPADATWHLEPQKSDHGWTVKVYGTGKNKLLVHDMHGTIRELPVDLTQNTETIVNL